jgi:hypothetical protein
VRRLLSNAEVLVQLESWFRWNRALVLSSIILHWKELASGIVGTPVARRPLLRNS